MVRSLELNDYDREYLDLLAQLTSIDPPISKENFAITLSAINSNPNHQIFVIPNLDNNKILASGTLLIEPKIIHGGASVAHIEDIVVDSSARGQGLGQKIVQHLIDQAKLDPTVYKISLYCSTELIPFYQKLNLQTKDQQMTLYLNDPISLSKL